MSQQPEQNKTVDFTKEAEALINQYGWLTAKDFEPVLRGIMHGYSLQSSQQTASLQKQLEERNREIDALRKVMKDDKRIHENELKEQQEEIDRLKEALDEIIYPVKYMQKRAKDQGAELNGYMAVQLSESPSHLKEIARKALQSPPGESEKENNK